MIYKDGFGVHAFRLVTDDGKSQFVKWHWKTKQGRASLVWEEAQTIAGKNADFHRADLFDAIESGNGPEWELAVQLVDEDKALAFGFDLLDPTKIIPEELAPLKKLGVMKLNRNPTNYFAETEQIMVSLRPTYSDPTCDHMVLCAGTNGRTCSSNQATSFEVSTSARIRCCRAASSPTSTLNSTDTAGQTSSSYPSISR